MRYHAALAEAQAGNVMLAVRQLQGLAGEYLSAIGLTTSTVLAKNPEQLRPLMRADADNADVRHIADCYDAIARITAPHPEYRKLRGLSPLWSTKFYALAGASRSFLRAGQEAVDAMLGDLGDPLAARDFMEKSLLRATEHARLPEMTIAIRAQYAVVCAQCGDFVRAREVMAALAPYADGLSPEGRAELANQQALVAQLQARGPLPAARIEAQRRRLEAQKAHAERLRAALGLGASPQPPPRASRKVGRNELCPCGSVRKFKKCCEASR